MTTILTLHWGCKVRNQLITDKNPSHTYVWRNQLIRTCKILTDQDSNILLSPHACGSNQDCKQTDTNIIKIMQINTYTMSQALSKVFVTSVNFRHQQTYFASK